MNLHQVDSAGHVFGRGPAYDQAVALADDEIERLVTTLRGLGEWERTVLIVLSDHSMDQVPTKVNLASCSKTPVSPPRPSTRCRATTGWPPTSTSPTGRAGTASRCCGQMREALAAHPAVSDALYREPNPEDGGAGHTLARVRPEWHVEGERSGDILVTAKSGTVFASHGQLDEPRPGPPRLELDPRQLLRGDRRRRPASASAP